MAAARRAPGSTPTSRGEQAEPGDDVTPGRPEEPAAPRAILVEPLSEGRYRIDLEAVNLEIKPLENGHYLIGPPVERRRRRGRRRQVGALDQAVARRPV